MERKVVLMVLISIFASLAAGIAVGMELIADPSLITEQTRWLVSLEQELDRIRGDAVRLQQEVEQYRADRNSDRMIEQWLVQRITGGTLVGRTVAVVGIGHTPAIAVVSDIVVMAGAELVYSVALDSTVVSAGAVAVCASSIHQADVAVICYEDLHTVDHVVPAVSSHRPVVVAQMSGQRLPVEQLSGVFAVVGDIDRGTGAVELCDLIARIAAGKT